MKIKQITTMACLLGLALILFTVEAQIPPLVPLPGVKLGLANIVVLVTMVLLGKKNAFWVLILRIILGSIMTASGIAFFYSLMGGLFCFAVMALCYPKASDRLWVISALGAIAHHVGQIITAIILLKSSSILIYFPPLLAAGIITGVFTGLCAQGSMKQWKK